MSDDYVKLEHPIKITTKDGAEQEISSLRFGRLKVKHLEHFPKALFSGDDSANKINPIEYIPLIASMSGITVDEAKEIDMVDLQPVVEKVVEKAGELNPRKTGEK